MSFPILYKHDDTEFGNNGIGILSDAISCTVTEEANGEFELEMQYPVDGIHAKSIAPRGIIKAKSNQDSKPQLFRVYNIKKSLSGNYRISARHISYDLSGIPVSMFSAENASSAMAGLVANAAIDCPFTFRTDKATVAPFSVDVPGSIRSKLGGSEGSILDVYGGEFEFDNYNVILHNSRGQNRDVTIRYGGNLTDFVQDRNNASVATGVYPFWVDAESGEVKELPEKIVRDSYNYGFESIKMLDASAHFLEAPSEEQLRDYAKSCIRSNKIGLPFVSTSISFSQLSQSDEYKDMALLEKVFLFDTVNVIVPQAFGTVSVSAKVVKLCYNVLLDRVEKITLGKVKAKISDTVANQQQQISQAPTRNDVQRASAAATAWLTNGKGYKVERRDDNGNTIDTLYMDTPDIETAVNVLRIGQSGIGFSQSGVNGPYYSAWTLDGTFDATWIKGGTISSRNDKIKIDLSGENEPKFNTGISTNGLTVRADDVNVGKAFWLQTYKSSSGTWVSDFRMNSANGNDIVRFTEIFSGGVNSGVSENLTSNEGTNVVQIVSDELDAGISIAHKKADNIYDIKGSLRYDSKSNKTMLWTDTINGKELSWKANGDGTYTLIGR